MRFVSPAQVRMGRVPRPFTGVPKPPLPRIPPADSAPAGLPSLVLAGYVFMLASYIAQFLHHMLGFNPRVVGVGFLVIGLVYLLHGDHLAFFRTPFAFPWLALLMWWLLAGALGIYPGRSVAYLVDYAIRIHLLPLYVCAIAVNLQSIRRVLIGAGFGFMAVLFFCYREGQQMENRFGIPDTSLGNGNDLALHLLMFGSMFLIFFGGGRMSKLLAAIVMPIALYYTLKTGSRANLTTLAALMATSFLLLPREKKVLVAIAAVLLPIAIFPLLPKPTADRLLTFFSTRDVQAETAHEQFLVQSAVDSTRARLQLQQRAIELTLEHPFLGIGALNFMDAVEDMVRDKEGRKSQWQVSHNSYLQVSSENGIPAFVFYVWSIVLCLRLNFRELRRPASNMRFLISFSLFLSSLTYSVGVLFCSIAYDFQLPLLVALTAATYLAFNRPAPRGAFRAA